MSKVRSPLKCHLKNQDGGRMADMLETRSVLHYHDHALLQFVDFQDCVCALYFGILKLTFLAAYHFRGTLCIVTLNVVEIC